MNEKRAKIVFGLNGLPKGQSMKYPAKSIESQVSTVTLRSPHCHFSPNPPPPRRRWSKAIVPGISFPLKWQTKCMGIRYLFLSNDLFIQQLIVAEWEGRPDEWSVPNCLEDRPLSTLSVNGTEHRKDNEKNSSKAIQWQIPLQILFAKIFTLSTDKYARQIGAPAKRSVVLSSSTVIVHPSLRKFLAIASFDLHWL